MSAPALFQLRHPGFKPGLRWAYATLRRSKPGLRISCADLRSFSQVVGRTIPRVGSLIQEWETLIQVRDKIISGLRRTIRSLRKAMRGVRISIQALEMLRGSRDNEWAAVVIIMPSRAPP